MVRPIMPCKKSFKLQARRLSTYRIAVCDDEDTTRETLCSLCREILTENSVACELTAFSPAHELEKRLQPGRFPAGAFKSPRRAVFHRVCPSAKAAKKGARAAYFPWDLSQRTQISDCDSKHPFRFRKGRKSPLSRTDIASRAEALVGRFFAVRRLLRGGFLIQNHRKGAGVSRGRCAFVFCFRTVRLTAILTAYKNVCFILICSNKKAPKKR